MRELTKKVIESGIVPRQSVELMKMWRCLPDDMPAGSSEEKTNQQLLQFVEEIAVLLESETELPELRETDLELDHLMKDKKVLVQLQPYPHQQKYDRCVARAYGGEFIFSVEAVSSPMLRLGGRIWYMGDAFEIMRVEPRYKEDQLAYYVCVVRGIEHAEL